MRKNTLLGGLLLAALSLPVTASAHEFVIAPEMWDTYHAGQAVPLSIYSTHVFLRAEELEKAESTELSYQGKALPLTANESWFTYDTKATLEGGGAAIFTGHRKPMLYEKKQYEKFAKLILPVDGKSAGYDKKVGQRLEIVPMSDPFAAKVGDEIGFKVLLDGKPAKFDTIYATYDGFSNITWSWAFAASPTAHGEGRVKITAPGLWMVRVAVDVDEKGEGYESVGLRSVLAFPVK